jgi:hypothetical protein
MDKIWTPLICLTLKKYRKLWSNKNKYTLHNKGCILISINHYIVCHNCSRTFIYYKYIIIFTPLPIIKIFDCNYSS